MNNVLFGDLEGLWVVINVDKIKWFNGFIFYEFDCSVGESLGLSCLK